MARKFNKEMEKYLRSKRERKIDIRFRKEPKPAEGVEVYEEGRPSLWERVFGPKQRQIPEDELSEEEKAKLATMEQEIEAVDEAEEAATDPEAIEELEEQREGLLERFFQSLRLFRRRHEVDERMEEVMEVEDAIDDKLLAMQAEFKEAMKITHKWLGKLTKRNRDEFMSSKDYKRYKEILQKYKVAK